MLYHYTSLSSFESILLEAKTHGHMCFWATRYDCFADTEELKLGVETIRRLLPEVEKDLPQDRQIAHLFDWNEIRDNKNLPYPYIVSFTSRPDNEHMWKNYANMDGVAMEIDNKHTVSIPDTPVIDLATCVYADDKSDTSILEVLKDGYEKVAYAALSGPLKDFAFMLLKDYPQTFVMIIATGLLSFAAPRIKRADNYKVEEETRAIIPLPTSKYISLIDGFDDIISKYGLSPSEIRALAAKEKSRKRENGSAVFYRELHLPINLLKGVYVKSQMGKEQVESFLKGNGIVVPVKLMIN